MSKEVINALDNIEPLVNELVTVIETLRDFETDEENVSADVQQIQQKLDKGTISKASFDKIVGKSEQKLAGIQTEKKENWETLISTLNSITDQLSKIKDQYAK